jgi:hypothetical protein
VILNLWRRADSFHAHSHARLHATQRT